jgi:hypothetical protein
MDRVDALHYEIIRSYPSGTIFHYLYDRGSFQSKEVAQNGLDRTPRNFIVPDADVREVSDTVYAWQDAVPGNINQAQPQTMPSPYNPAPFPNLPPGCRPPNRLPATSRPLSHCTFTGTKAPDAMPNRPVAITSTVYVLPRKMRGIAGTS